MKILVIGSGPIVIGQAAEFDYAGTQACKALREEGHSVVLVNSNPATIMTDPGVADALYIEPLNVDFLERVIARERPEALLPTLGGQTGLNLATQLDDAGILAKYNLKVLGTPLSAIKKAEDRESFRALMREIKEPVPESWIVESEDDLRAVLDVVPYPCIIRPAYTLGGTGGGIANTREELWETGRKGLKLSLRSQLMVERSLLGWKEIEYEVMRDAMGNTITVCNMENFDPMGVHTGDSIVVAPSQTLSDLEYHMMRTASLKIIDALGIEGGCNVQMALNPEGFDYYIIEVNPRVSRSSALASKATGYPIARVAAKIAVGRTLDQIDNQVTGTTKACFEPALDYCVVKIPRWPFDKFATGDRSLFTQMKATGEVMAIDRSFEAAFMKAIRGLEIKQKDLRHPKMHALDDDGLRSAIGKPTDERLWALAEGLRRGWGVDEVNRISHVDRWFLRKIQTLVDVEARLRNAGATFGETEELAPLIQEAFLLGYPSSTIDSLLGGVLKQSRKKKEIEAMETRIRERLTDRPVLAVMFGTTRRFHEEADLTADLATNEVLMKRIQEEALADFPEYRELLADVGQIAAEFAALRTPEERQRTNERVDSARRNLDRQMAEEVLATAERQEPLSGAEAQAFWQKAADEIERQKVMPVFKMVDTCAGEFESRTPYYYGTFEQEDDAA